MYLGCTSNVPRLYLGCTSAVPRLSFGCPSAAFRLPLGCSLATRWLYHGFPRSTSVALAGVTRPRDVRGARVVRTSFRAELSPRDQPKSTNIGARLARPLPGRRGSRLRGRDRVGRRRRDPRGRGVAASAGGRDSGGESERCALGGCAGGGWPKMTIGPDICDLITDALAVSSSFLF